MATEPLEKTKKLLIALELLALATSVILVLIDYRLKQDLLNLFRRIEAGIETASGLLGKDPNFSPDTSGLSGSPLVGDNPIVEATASHSKAPANGAGRKTANRRTPANGSGGAGSPQISESDK